MQFAVPAANRVKMKKRTKKHKKKKKKHEKIDEYLGFSREQKTEVYEDVIHTNYSWGSWNGPRLPGGKKKKRSKKELRPLRPQHW